jgi:hypothetical protein
MGVNELRWATTTTAIDQSAPSLFTTGQTLNAPGFTAGSLSYYHKASIDLSGHPSGTVFCLRTYYHDGVQPTVTTIPNEGSNSVITSLFTLEIL